MGRKRESNFALPPRMHLKGRVYYYVTSTSPRKWIKLDKDLSAAKVLWAKHEAVEVDEHTKSFRNVVRRYIRDVLPSKAPQTQKDNHKEMAKLLPVFGDMPIDSIQPHDVRTYLDLRGKTAKVRANREKALLSHIFNFARETGYTASPNPCAGVKGFKENGRDVYVEDEQYRAVWNAGTWPLRDAMDLALALGQRPADTLKLRETDIRDGFLYIQQNKTRQKLRVRVSGALLEIIERTKSRKRLLASPASKVFSIFLVCDEEGGKLTSSQLRKRFDAARLASRQTFQFRDIRAKAGTDLDDLAHAQKLLGHKNRKTTELYIRNRKGDVVEPLEAKIVESG
jgi:integrase